VHEPQPSVPPHPFDGLPQVAPSEAQVAGVHAHVPDMQVWGAVQLPQLSVLPQPSET
jgi:hypothetical protein